MAKLIVIFKDGAGRLEIETSEQAALRVFNRYQTFMRSGEQAATKFVLDDPEPGFLALDFDKVVAMQVSGV